MKNVKKSFRKTELALFVIGLLIAILFYLILPTLMKTHSFTLGDSSHNFFGEHLKFGLLGYLFGFLAFTISYELFFLFEPNPKFRKWGYLLLTNLKLVIIGGLFYYVRLTGIPATSLVVGFIACETLAVFVLLFNAYRSNNFLKVSKVKTDSSE